MKKIVVGLIPLIISTSVLADNICYSSIPEGLDEVMIKEVESNTLGSGQIYSNNKMQGVIFTSYLAPEKFSFKKITLCDKESATPLSKNWQIDSKENGYAHDINQQGKGDPVTVYKSELIQDSLYDKYTVAQFLRSSTPISSEVCSVVSGYQTVETESGATEEIPVRVSNCDSFESAYISAEESLKTNITPDAYFGKHTFNSNKYHDFVKYELKTSDSYHVVPESITYSVGGTTSNINVKVKTNHPGLILRDRQLHDVNVSWTGVFAITPEQTVNMRHINESSKTVGNVSIPEPTTDDNTIAHFIQAQLHKKSIYYLDYFLQRAYSSIRGEYYYGYNYDGVFRDYPSQLLPSENDILENIISFDDIYGLSYKIRIKFSNNGESLMTF
ncbi:hypothetical protein [Psychromonas sp. Urea-02u-13]|uniref:hypothetical protein n=1 Tax=Psychromonas sp. Urea-02u-13 TaxID=2058326 RepID=UPI000C32C850|nr:hypothetical protein [Psychromonas sp. Urea-02u-13]PKG39730.1 hypothetical protein CXF74_06640 [Psychromonas sp. Urea-02u-13]